MKPVNHLAILVAAVVFFVIGAVSYTVFAQPWLDAQQFARAGDRFGRAAAEARNASRPGDEAALLERAAACAARSVG